MTLIRRRMTAQIARLELRLILRNRAARYLVIAVPLMAIPLAVLMLNFPGPSVHVADIVYVACMFTPFTYASLAFSWNATNWASLFQLPVEPKDQIAGRFLVLTCLSVPPVIILAAFAVWLRPEFAMLTMAAGMFGVTVVSIPSLLVSATTPKSVDANAPIFADTKKFGWQHWVAFLVIVAPGNILTRIVTFEQFVAVIGTIAVIALAALPFTLRYGSQVLSNSIPKLSDRLLSR